MSIDMNRAGVKKLLGDQYRDELAQPGTKRELVTLAGDEDSGLRSSVRLDTGKHEILVHYPRQDQWLVVDVYLMPGEPPELVFICPRCHKAGRIKGANKKIELDLAAKAPIDPNKVPPEFRHLTVGHLSVEPFECSWELEADRQLSRHAAGLNLCRWKAAIEDNIARDA